ncbi:hypothetical protein [Hymenobacter algoricola]|uniref:DUF5004 domain-containing protein n=1 Tax=Hymenobacter algoricola TaxID=486267 RepID=A0ABP7MXW8_9BACT
MKKMSVLLGLAAAASLSLASCQKELDQVRPAQASAAIQTQSKSDLLTTSAWRLTNLTSSTALSGASAATTVDLLDRLKPWARDNVFTYAAGGAFTLDEAAIKIHPQAPQQTTGTWKLSPQGDSLTVTQDTNVRRYGVAELSATTLRLTVAQPGAPTTFTQVYSH